MSHYANTDGNVDNHRRSRRLPLRIPSFEVTNTDVEAADSLLNGLTISGTPSPTVMSGATYPTTTSSAQWAMINHPVITTRSRAELSVMTAQTVPPSTTGVGLFGGGGINGGGGSGGVGIVVGGGFNVLHVHPKMPFRGNGKFKLLKCATGDGCCMGFVGASKEIICVNKRCNIAAHSKASGKWDPKAAVVFLIPALKQGKSSTAFVIPGGVVVGDGLPEWCIKEAEQHSKTLKAWVDEFIPRAQSAYIQSIAEEESDDENQEVDLDLDTSELVTGLVWEDIEEDEYAAFVAEEEINKAEDGPFAIELRKSIIQVRNNLMKARVEAREDVERMATVVVNTNKWLIDTLTPLNTTVGLLQEGLGDISTITTMYPYPTTLTGGMQHIVSELDEVRQDQMQNLKELQVKLEQLDEDFVVVDQDVIGIGTALPGVFNQVADLQSRLQLLESTFSQGSLPKAGDLLTTSFVVDNTTGLSVVSLGQLIQTTKALEIDNLRLRAEIGGKGGVAVGSFTFGSIKDLEDLIRSELPAGGPFAFELFVDISTLLCHNSNFDPGNSTSSIEWNKATKEMANKGFSDTARKLVRSVHEPVSALYTNGKEAIAGSVVAAFKTSGTWTGVGGRDGQRHKIEEKVNTAKMSAIASINARLPIGSTLRALALFLVDRAVLWYTDLHRHLDNDLQRLTQMGLDKEAVLVLLSEEIIILYTLVHNVRKKGQEFTVSCDPMDFMVQCVWITLECHGAMDDEIKNGISSSGAINSAFVRFLTNQLAGMAKAGGGGADSKWDAWKQKWEGKINDAVVSSGQAKADAKASQAESTANKKATEALAVKVTALRR